MQERRYNVTYNPIPPDSSVMPGGDFIAVSFTALFNCSRAGSVCQAFTSSRGLMFGLWSGGSRLGELWQRECFLQRKD